MAENFVLRWNDHHAEVMSSASRLQELASLTDLTVVTAAQSFPAHKLVLSVCSTFFSSLFTEGGALSDQSKAVIYLKDVSSDHLELLLRFMYAGEVKIPEADLLSVLATARSLQIRGLCNLDNSGEQQEQGEEGKQAVPDRTRVPQAASLAAGPRQRAQPRSAPAAVVPDRHAHSESSRQRCKEDSVQGLPLLQHQKSGTFWRESLVSPPRSVSEAPAPAGNSSEGGDSGGKRRSKRKLEPGPVSDAQVGRLAMSSVEGWRSGDALNDQLVSSKQEGQQLSLLHMDEVEEVVEEEEWVDEYSETLDSDLKEGAEQGGSHACIDCSKVFSSNWRLKRHILTHTKEQQSQCEVCYKFFSRRDNLRSHQRAVHGHAQPGLQPIKAFVY